MRVALIRGTYFNRFEMQNYEPLVGRHRLVGFAGLRPIHKNYRFSLVKLPSPVDLPNFPYKMPILNRMFTDAMFLIGLERKLKGFDIAHVRETYFHFTQQALDAKKKGYVKKVIATCSETIPFNHEGIWGRKKFKKRAIKEIDYFHCLSRKAKQALITEGCDPKKIVVFPYGVDIVKFKPGEQVSTLNQQPIVKLLFVGRLEKEKGIFELLTTFVQLIKVYPKLRLTIVGNGSQKHRLTTLIDKSGLQEVVQLIKVAYEEIPQQYQKADIFVLPSKPTKHWEEYFGMALVEAMASGLPLVSTTCGAIPEVVGSSGILVKPGASEELYQALKGLVLSPQLRKKLGRKARRRAEKMYDIHKVSKRIEDFWKKALEKNGY